VSGEVFLDERRLAERVAALGTELSRDYGGKHPLFIGILKSAAVFLADLVRALSIPAEYDLLALSSYARERERGGRQSIRIEKDLAQPIESRHVVVVDDVVDTGLTMQYVLRTLAARNPASIAVCTLLDRPHRRIAEVPIRYRGFTIPDVFLAGYGMDDAGRLRELPDLRIVETP